LHRRDHRRGKADAAAVNPRTWINQTDYRELEFRPSLRAFATQLAEFLAVLEPLPPEGWSRAVTVTGAGKALERTVLFYARWLAEHERPHVGQVARIVHAMSVEQRRETFRRDVDFAEARSSSK
jgi:hypothetical protein